MLTEELTKTQSVSKTELNMPPHVLGKPEKKPPLCIYMKTKEPSIPLKKHPPFAVCKTCPYAYICAFGDAARDLYNKIVGLAVFFFNTGAAAPSMFFKKKENRSFGKKN